MVKGQTGLYLEAWKFSVYVGIPIVASMTFNSPTIQKYSADYFQFLKYPANPNTNLKEDFKKFQEDFEKTQQQRDEYRAQLNKLEKQAEMALENSLHQDKRRGWFGLW
jgi:hypothetical protein